MASSSICIYDSESDRASALATSPRSEHILSLDKPRQGRVAPGRVIVYIIDDGSLPDDNAAVKES